MKNGWHTGKGSNCLKKNDHSTAIKHLLKALECSAKTNNKANVAFGHEILADAYLRAHEYGKAEDHANHSCAMYSQFLKGGSSKIFSERLRNSMNILVKIRHNKPINTDRKTSAV